MKLYITRHGQTEWNALRKIQGRTDIPLNETGKKQAAITRDELRNIKLDYIISSPLSRAVETATIINQVHNLPIIQDERIIERGFGEMEGCHITEIDFTNFWRPEKEHLFPQCEKTTIFYQRVQSFIDEMIHSYENETILVVAHGGVSLPFYTYFHGFPDAQDMRKFMLNNCEIACYEVGNREECDTI